MTSDLFNCCWPWCLRDSDSSRTAFYLWYTWPWRHYKPPWMQWCNQGHPCLVSGGISPHPYSDGLPWESVLVPLLCSIYAIYNYNNLCCFADDTPLYVALTGSKINTTSSLMTSLSDLKCLKSVNFLKVSDFKSEVLLFATPKPDMNLTNKIWETWSSKPLHPQAEWLRPLSIQTNHQHTTSIFSAAKN